jgi:hypothetical protein
MGIFYREFLYLLLNYEAHSDKHHVSWSLSHIYHNKHSALMNTHKSMRWIIVFPHTQTLWKWYSHNNNKTTSLPTCIIILNLADFAHYFSFLLEYINCKRDFVIFSYLCMMYFDHIYHLWYCSYLLPCPFPFQILLAFMSFFWFALDFICD